MAALMSLRNPKAPWMWSVQSPDLRATGRRMEEKEASVETPAGL